MLRLARLAMYGLTTATVLALAQAHAEWVGAYELGGTRLWWSVAYIVLLCGAAYGLGLPDLPRNAYQFMMSASGASAAAAVGISVAQLAVGSQLLPRFVVFWSAVFLVPGWALCGFIASRGRRREVRRDRVVLVAGSEEASLVERDLARRPEHRARLVAVVGPEQALGRLEAVVREAQASVIALSREALASDDLVEIVAQLHEHGVRVRTLSLFYDEWLGKLPLSELERVALMFDIGDIHRARYGRIKRSGDLAVAVGLLPLVVIAGVLIALANPVFGNRGPLLFRQTRVGRNERTFTILKFRTMRPDTSHDADWTSANDPRVTPFGRVLRATHIDELPQIVNVLRGDLSIVGPRPEQPRYVDELAEAIPFYRLRHLVRPGVTGWAQVKYSYGSSHEDAMEKLQYEFWYLRHQSLTLDLKIIGRTLRSVGTRTGR